MNNKLGVTIALVHVFLPFMILPLIGNIQAIDPTLEAAATFAGRQPRLKVFWRHHPAVKPCPASRPASILVFVLTLSAYVTPVMLGGAQVKHHDGAGGAEPRRQLPVAGRRGPGAGAVAVGRRGGDSSIPASPAA